MALKITIKTARFFLFPIYNWLTVSAMKKLKKKELNKVDHIRVETKTVQKISVQKQMLSSQVL